MHYGGRRYIKYLLEERVLLAEPLPPACLGSVLKLEAVSLLVLGALESQHTPMSICVLNAASEARLRVSSPLSRGLYRYISIAL